MYIGLHVKYPIFLSDLNETLFFPKYFPIIIKFNESPPVVAKYFHANKRDEANSRLWEFWEQA